MRLSSLSFLFISGALSVSAYELHLFPAESTYNPSINVLHRNLGLEEGPLILEDFEDQDMIQGLKTNFSETEKNRSTAWDGTRVGGPFDDAEFEIGVKNVRLFGIAIADNDGGQEQVTVNQTKTVHLQQLPFFTSRSASRAYYLIIVATEDDPDIRTIRFSNAFSIHCDHLILKQVNPQPTDKHVINLRDKSKSLFEKTNHIGNQPN